MRLSDNPSSVSNNEINNMPVIAYLGYSIHGNEASGTEAAILLLYHLAAGKGYEIDQILKIQFSLLIQCLTLMVGIVCELGQWKSRLSCYR